jgi:hypothetical protein
MIKYLSQRWRTALWALGALGVLTTTVMVAPPPASAAMKGGVTGYQIVESAQLAAPAGVQTRGSVTCPGAKVPLSGGALVAATDLDVNLGGVFPKGQAWKAVVNNASATPTTFRVWAVCAQRPAGYTVVVNKIQASTFSQTRNQAVCPKGLDAIGGGGSTSSTQTDVNLATSAPIGAVSWSSNVNNGSGLIVTWKAYAICVSPLPGYNLQINLAVTVPSGTERAARTDCPSPSLPIGGGSATGSADTAQSLNSDWPTSAGWEVFQNNDSLNSVFVNVWVVCAGA